MSGIPFTDDELYLVWRLGCSDAEAREAVRELAPPFIVLSGDTLLILSLISEDTAARVREFVAAKEGHDVTNSPEWLHRLEELRPWVETRLRELREESGDG